MQQVLTGAKNVLNTEKVNKINVPCYPELSVRQLYDSLTDDEEVLSHLPDYVKRAPDRTFVWATVHALRPNFVRQAVAKAQQLRHEYRQ